MAKEHGSSVEVGGDMVATRPSTPWSQWLLFCLLTALPIAALYYQMTIIQKQNAEIIKENHNLKETVDLLKVSTRQNDEAKPQVQVSTAYVRWGRTQCPPEAKEVYKGYVGGSWFSDKGGSSEYLCLPEEPQWGRYKEGLQQGSFLHAAEYQLADYQDDDSLLLQTNNDGKSLLDENAPCVLCQVDGRSISRTFPAMKECPSGWTREYHGYLMSQHWSEGSKGPICVDEAPEGVPGKSDNTNGATLYHIEFKCDTMSCPPYEQAREAVCAVCTL